MTQEQLLLEAKKTAQYSINNFLDKLNINPEAFNHLYEIPMTVDMLELNHEAQYDANYELGLKTIPLITINEYYVDGLLYYLNNNIYDKNLIINNLASVMVHELLHANRTVYIAGGMSPYNIVDGFNDKLKKYKIKLELDDNREKYILTAPDYYHDYFDIDLNNVKDYNAYFSNIIKNKIMKTIENQNGLEEAIVETMANLIVKTKDTKNINLDEEMNFFINNKTTRKEEKIAAHIIKRMGKDFLTWFMLSAYQEVYTNKIQNEFQNKYERIIEITNNLYSNNSKNRKKDYLEAVTLIKNK